jgi:ribosomal protein L29
MSDLKEMAKNILNIVEKTEKTDEHIAKIVNNLKIILLNLRIENARIKDNTGIQPIIEELEKSVNKINKELKDSITENHKDLINIIESLNEYLGGSYNENDITITEQTRDKDNQ